MTLAEHSHDAPPVEMVTLTIDGTEISVPKGTLVIRAAELIGVQIPRFCDHPLLDPVGACRQCLVEVEGQRKPLASCTTTVTPDMVVRTQHTSEAADKAQHGVMELLLINHPLDCPVCDKGGECPLQNQAMSNGRAETRFEDVKRTFPKPIAISSQVLLDRERCVLCARCTRFSDQIAGDRFIDLMERGALQQVGIAPGEPFQSYFSGNTVQICPVGALTGAAYRFRARPFDLVSSPSACEHCASGCAQRTDHRRGKVLRRLAGDDPEVNEEWNCDKGRWAFTYATVGDRLTTPLVREEGALRPASWSEALGVAAAGLTAAAGNAGVLVGGRVTAEEAYAYAKFARIVLGTNDIDFRSRPHSAEEADFLATHVAGLPMTVTYADIEKAPAVLLAGLEPEEESPIVFLRLRKAARKRGLQVLSVAPLATRALGKLSGRLIRCAPGAEAVALDGLAGDALLAMPGALLLVGERLATSPGALSAVGRLAEATGARIAWIPRRAGDRGAVEAGALPNLLPGGRPVQDASARRQIADAWHVDDLPATAGPGHRGDPGCRRCGGPGRPADRRGRTRPIFPTPTPRSPRWHAARFVVSLELRHSAVTERADVVFPVAPVVEKAGSFVNWEGRIRPFAPSLHTNAVSDLRVLNFLADEIGVDLGLSTEAAADERARLGMWSGTSDRARTGDPSPPQPHAGQAVLAGWRMLLDDGRLQDGEPHLAGTARTPVARLSRTTAAEVGVADGELVTVSTDRGAITLPLQVTDMDDRVVWLPLNSPGSSRASDTRRDHGRRGVGRERLESGMTYPDPTLFGHDPWWLILAKSLGIFVFLLLTVLAAILIERKILGRMQLRIGPNRVGPGGLLQSLADGVKLALKEGLIPAGVDKGIYLAAPVIAVIPAFMAFAVIPLGGEVSVFGHRTALQLTDLPVAVLYILAVTSIGVYGIVLAGWASGSVYPLLGGLRSTAQVISYEIAMALSFVAVFIYAGTMSTSGIVAAQNDTWYIFLLLPSFLVYLTSMVGETNRAPFDLPEAEGELVGGFHTEYSSLKFAMFMLAEYVNMTTVSALATTLFLGGWHAPWPISLWEGANSGLVAAVVVHRQGVAVPVRVHVAARHPAAHALRPVHGIGLEDPDPGVAGLDRDRGHHRTRCATRAIRRGPSRWSGSRSSQHLLLALLGWERLRRGRIRPNPYRPAPPPYAGAFPVPPVPVRRRAQMPKFLDSVAGFGVTFGSMFKKPVTEQYPEKPGPVRQAVPRPPSAQPVPRRPGEVHRL